MADNSGIKLFEHNKTAYISAVKMLSETGKAAVIHPTGTGKSFIAFKLCEDNKDKKICWLSPGEYIFKTQCENLSATGVAVPCNIAFFTYAKLMLMADSEISEIKPDYIILDEFHRCGAEMWGKGVENLLKTYPDTPVLGLSATAIRYLDNKRNMADELFDGNIASEMTLGEAIVRGILRSPKYVIALYSYQKDFEKYEYRVRHAQSKIVRDAGEKYLQALKRAIEKADGLDTVFKKHIKNKSGKYIVFCSGLSHMNEMAEKAPEWFSEIDKNPHIYKAYSNDPATSKAFADFKADVSEHLKLLYSIDMLNEGIHVDGIDGVILLRPTVSPIIYKQQIGRALCTGSNKNAVILDIVDNISGLYSVGAIEEEIKDAVNFYNYRGESSYIVNDNFKIIDEVADCKKLFDELEKTLSASWEFMYAEAEKYYRENGDLLPPQAYVTPDGYKLGQWITVQRENRNKNDPALNPERIAKLDKIGMQWLGIKDRLWEEGFKKAKDYYNEHGHLRVKKEEDSTLTAWVIRQRQKYRSNELSADRFKRLSEIGMVWDFEENWNTKFQAVKSFYYENGHLDVPADYITKDGIALGRWLRTVKNSYNFGLLPIDKQAQLESIGMKWDSVIDRTWTLFFELAKNYYQAHGNLNVHAKYETDDGAKLGTWISSQRYAYNNNRLSPEKTDLLESIGMSWQRDQSRWEEGFTHASDFFEKNGALNPSVSYVCEDGFKLGSWVASQRHKYQAGKLSEEKIKRLEGLKIYWNPIESLWQEGYANALEYFRANGNLNTNGDYITDSGYKLGFWLNNQRTKYKNGTQSPEHTELLNKIGMIWNKSESKWYEGYSYAAEYSKTGDINSVKQAYCTPDGYKLGEWLNGQKRQYSKGEFDSERQKRLENIGMYFNQ